MATSNHDESELLLNENAENVLEDIQDFDDSLFELDEEAMDAGEDEGTKEPFIETFEKVKSVKSNYIMSSLEKVHRCTECAYSTSNYSRFKKHVQYHSMPLIKCDLCEFRTPYKWNLDRHMRSHNDEGQFKCDICLFSANIRQSISFHIQHHHLRPSLSVQRFKAKSIIVDQHLSMFKDLDDLDDSLVNDVIMADDSVVDDTSEVNKDLLDEEALDLIDGTPDVPLTEDIEIPVSLPSEISIKLVEKRKDNKESVRVDSDLGVSVRRTSVESNLKSSGIVNANKTEKSSVKRPPPCLIPLSQHNNFPPDSQTVSATAAGDSRGASPPNPANKATVSVLDRLFNKRMAASSLSEKVEASLGELTVKPSSSIQSSSNRCPYCRHRCKTTDDLRNHKRVCQQAPQSLDSSVDSDKKMDDNAEHDDDDILILDELTPSSATASKKVLPSSLSIAIHQNESSTSNDVSTSDIAAGFNLVKRRVYKCPYCSFWAATASRFHVHLVGHKNMRPYECSVCSYRSNWRWDITKHIRMKSSRDLTHNRAKLIIRDEGNLRDYDKYEEYLVVMIVEEGLQCQPQEALMSRKLRVCPEVTQNSDVIPPLSTMPPSMSFFGSGIGMTPMPSTNSLFSRVPLLPPPTRFVLTSQLPGARAPGVNSLRLPQVQSVRLPTLPSVSSTPSLFFGSDMTVTKLTVPSTATTSAVSEDPSALDSSLEQDVSITPSLESLKEMDPTLAAMGLTSENTAIVLPEPPPDARATGDLAKKATVWRCKKCPFKNRDKRAMLAHVALHSGLGGYNCGHCGKPGDCENTLKRHCRIKHGGVVSIVKNKMAASLHTNKSAAFDDPDNLSTNNAEISQCPLCPFVSVADETGHEMRTHMGHHAPSPSASLKCTECPYYVSTKKALVEHMTLHGVISQPKDGKLKSGGVVFDRVGAPDIQDRDAPYRCLHCAFSTHTKTQLLSHRQFHALRNLPLQCPCCTFNVNQLSQLADHVQLHGLQCRGAGDSAASSRDPTSSASAAAGSFNSDIHTDPANRRVSPLKSTPGPASAASKPAHSAGSVYTIYVSGEPVSGTSLPLLPDSATAHLSHIPLVWASRGDRFFRAYKCRRCPHLSVLRAYIEEHERLHVTRRDPCFGHQCDRCHYVCVSGAVLAGHRRVHQYSLGRVHSLAGSGQSGGQEEEGEDLEEEESSSSRVRQKQQLLLLLTEEQRVEAVVRVFGVGGASRQLQLLHEQKQLQLQQQLAAKSLYTAGDRARPAQTDAEYGKPCGDNSVGGGGGGVTAFTSTAAVPTTSSGRTLYFCRHCPARFFHEKEIAIHARFHNMNLPYACDQCSYMARQQNHLLAHFRAHSREYHQRTISLMALYGHAPSHPPPPSLSRDTHSPPPAAAAEVEALGDGHTSASQWKQLPSPAAAAAGARGCSSGGGEGAADDKQYTPGGFLRRFSCTQCPARFVKEATMRNHLTLHGSGNPYVCTHCDYAVKTQAHLAKHLTVHQQQQQQQQQYGTAVDGVGSHGGRAAAADDDDDDFPVSGVDLLRRKMDFEREHQDQQQQQQEHRLPTSNCTESPRKTMRLSAPLVSGCDSNGGGDSTSTGRPERDRPRPFKCTKCPSSFYKRDQFVTHAALHGARNRFRCTVCDYSVKFWANYLVHMRCHGVPAPSLKEAERHQQNHLSGQLANSPPNHQQAANGLLSRSRRDDPGSAAGGALSPGAKWERGGGVEPVAPELSVAERQDMILRQLRDDQDGTKVECDASRRWYRCHLCPYTSQRRDHTDYHRWRHARLGARGNVTCRFCDYLCFHGHMIRYQDHMRLHLRPARQLRIDSFTRLEQLHVFVKEVSDTAAEDDGAICFEDVDTSTHETLFDAGAASVARELELLDQLCDPDSPAAAAAAAAAAGGGDRDQSALPVELRSERRACVLVDLVTGDVIGETAPPDRATANSRVREGDDSGGGGGEAIDQHQSPPPAAAAAAAAAGGGGDGNGEGEERKEAGAAEAEQVASAVVQQEPVEEEDGGREASEADEHDVALDDEDADQEDVENNSSRCSVEGDYDSSVKEADKVVKDKSLETDEPSVLQEHEMDEDLERDVLEQDGFAGDNEDCDMAELDCDYADMIQDATPANDDDDDDTTQLDRSQDFGQTGDGQKAEVSEVETPPLPTVKSQVADRSAASGPLANGPAHGAAPPPHSSGVASPPAAMASV